MRDFKNLAHHGVETEELRNEKGLQVQETKSSKSRHAHEERKQRELWHIRSLQTRGSEARETTTAGEDAELELQLQGGSDDLAAKKKKNIFSEET